MYSTLRFALAFCAVPQKWNSVNTNGFKTRFRVSAMEFPFWGVDMRMKRRKEKGLVCKRRVNGFLCDLSM